MLRKYLGCMYGLAVGDALGAPVEFMRLDEIKGAYGEKGIMDFDSWDDFPPGSYTDDTQMALATAKGCLKAYKRGKERGIWHPATQIYYEYLDWLELQEDPFYNRRPGHTCISALKANDMCTVKNRINNSKGCGGVMRIAPIGLTFDLQEAFKYGMEAAALTHGHPSGYLSAGFLALVIAYMLRGYQLVEAIDFAIDDLVLYQGYEETLSKVRQAIVLSRSALEDEEAIEELGEGWVGEEALAISLFCALRYPENWREGVLASINHSGDSDSTGAITGAILGTLLGWEAIPRTWIEELEDSKEIKSLTEELYDIKKGKG